MLNGKTMKQVVCTWVIEAFTNMTQKKQISGKLVITSGVNCIFYVDVIFPTSFKHLCKGS